MSLGAPAAPVSPNRRTLFVCSWCGARPDGGGAAGGVENYGICASCLRHRLASLAKPPLARLRSLRKPRSPAG
jgi:hypothetical protein